MTLFVGGENLVLGPNAPGASGGDGYVRMLQANEDLQNIGLKSSQLGFDTVIVCMLLLLLKLVQLKF